LSRSAQLLCCALLALVLAAQSVAADSGQPLDLSLPALGGGAPIQLTHYRDKIVYLDVWASWCTACVHSMPELEKLRERFHGQPFEVVAVNVDNDAAKARAFLERVGVSYPVAFDRDGLQLRARVPDESDLAGLPVGFLLDGRGTLRLVHRGYSPGQSAFLSAHIETLLAELRVESDTRR